MLRLLNLSFHPSPVSAKQFYQEKARTYQAFCRFWMLIFLNRPNSNHIWSFIIIVAIIHIITIIITIIIIIVIIITGIKSQLRREEKMT